MFKLSLNHKTTNYIFTSTQEDTEDSPGMQLHPYFI